METSKKINELIKEFSFAWVCRKTGLNKGTLYSRLRENIWKPTEVFFIDSLYEKYKSDGIL